MAPLSADDFPEFFEALWRTDSQRVEPFPWQRRLMRLVADERKGWPQILDLPTGSGKTAVLDIAVLHLAVEASRGPGVMRAARRIIMVVDRRTVVDQAYERARFIADKLKQATKGILFEVAVALRQLVEGRVGTADPLMCAVLRGGMYRDPSWARTPDQPLIVASTVDQVGSRLLFRGYGVSDSMRPVHAGLLANDALILLDEVHLSRAFEETLSALERYRGWAERPVSAPWKVVRMSATPHVVDDEDRASFGLDGDDRKSPVLAKRLGAHKPARIRSVRSKGEERERRERFASECGKEAIALLEEGARTVAVVVNRVDTARRVYACLATPAQSDPPRADADVYLLTGRMRPFDRDDVVALVLPRVRAGRVRAPDDHPLVVVATQSIEAGADFDFDALVTECASLDSLRQRFGRLDRMGEYGKARAVILGRTDEIEGREDSSVYGKALGATWEWLGRTEEWDFGIDHLELPKKMEPFLAGAADADGREHAPVLLPAHLDAWVQTSPAPAADPDVSLWLHGLTGRPADVQIVWRADLSEEDLRPSRQQYVKNLMSACPPAPAEALAVPFRAAREWLLRVPAGDVSDVEGEAPTAETEVRTSAPRYVVRWRGDDTEVITVSGARREKTLRPGDTIVVPAAYGGLDRIHRNWDPESERSSEDIGLDLGDVVQLPQKGRAVLRLHPAALNSLGLPEAPVPPEDASSQEERDQIRGWLEALKPDLPTRPHLAAAVDDLLQELRQGRWSLKVIDGGRDVQRVLVGRRLLKKGDDVTTEPDVSSFTGVPSPVALNTHSEGVERWVRGFGGHCGLDDPLTDDLALAGQFHDVGKADPRFQTLLWGGDEVAALASGQVIAKSGVTHRDRASRERARALSRYPRGTRHEMLSLALVEPVSELRERARDWDLVLHLIATHHGHARPFGPPVEDPEDLTLAFVHGGTQFKGHTRHHQARLDSPVGDRFWRLVREYGWYGLAWLEAILRLADHRRSEEEAEEAGR